MPNDSTGKNILFGFVLGASLAVATIAVLSARRRAQQRVIPPKRLLDKLGPRRTERVGRRLDASIVRMRSAGY